MHKYDIIIVGAGIAGLYAYYKLKIIYPEKKILILEQNKKKYIGGRLGNRKFYGVRIVNGGGVGRKDKDVILLKLLNELHFEYHFFESKHQYEKSLNIVNIKKIINLLKKYKIPNTTFKIFAENILKKELYKKFVATTGYTDFETQGAQDTLYNYEFDDMYNSWTGISIYWKELIATLIKKINMKNIHTSTKLLKIQNIKNKYILTTDNRMYKTTHLILALTANSIKYLFQNTEKINIYKYINSQPFLRIYGKFTKKSNIIMKELCNIYTVVKPPICKIIPMNSDKGVYMIVYNDNKNAKYLNKYSDDTEYNRNFLCRLLEKTLNIEKNKLKLKGIKSFYWNEGTHYYKDFNNDFKNRKQFIKIAQHPYKNMYVVGEMVSNQQGWVEGALESVENILNKI